jgi:hypothetical protein
MWAHSDRIATKNYTHRPINQSRLSRVAAPSHEADSCDEEFEQCVEHAITINGVTDYGVGADRGGFVKLADAIVAMGV